MNQVVEHNDGPYLIYRLEWADGPKYFLGMVKCVEGTPVKELVLNDLRSVAKPSHGQLMALACFPSSIFLQIGAVARPMSKVKDMLERDLFNNRYDPHCLNNVKPAVMV